MSNKTECRCYNEDDFVQREESLDELTVTITLCEYRNLISEQTRLDITVDRLQEEKAELVKQLEKARQVLATCKMPEWVKSIGNTLAHWGEDQDNGEDATQDECKS